MNIKVALVGILLATTTAVANAAPGIQWVNPDYDFGAIAEADGVASGQFVFVNSGDSPVSIVSVRTSCGCTTVDLPLDEINPGDTAVIAVQYDPTGRPGKFEKKIMVNFSDDQPRASLRVHGVVIGTAKTLQNRYPIDAGVIRLHSTIIPFGDVKKSAAKSDFIEIYNASRDTISPKWTNIPEYINVAPMESSIPPGHQAVYNVMFSGYRCKQYGMVLDSLNVAATSESVPVKIDIIGTINEDFSKWTAEDIAKAPVISVESERIDFGTFDPTKTIEKTFEIKNKGENPLILRRVHTVDKGVAVSVDKEKIKKGKTAKVTITVNPESLESGVLNSRITIISNDPGNSNIIIRAVGLPSDF